MLSDEALASRFTRLSRRDSPRARRPSARRNMSSRRCISLSIWFSARRARGITDAEILSGRQRVFIRYATPEAKSFFAENPRPTGAYLRRGADTRVVYSDPGSRRR